VPAERFARGPEFAPSATPTRRVVVNKLASLSLVAVAFAPACSSAQEGVAAPTSNVAAVSSKVEPGKVHWHASLAESIAAAEKTGKPVLHFQLLGDLDQEFC